MKKLLSRVSITHNLTNDDVREIAMNIVDALVEEQLIEDNIGTNNETEFEFQDLIHAKLNELFQIKED